ncbi:MAG: glycosyltransferase, partial [Candidatus Eremiobacteraeota bacterium]|nr:glycosyltransferase [Candidatus Eremiobacteraeota bacterium]
MPLEIADDYADSDFARNQTGLLFNLPAPQDGLEQLPAGISLCMIVKNEERFLRECIASVRDVVDEIVVVDTGSTDATVEIAQSFGARVEHREWRNDFSWARNEALALATRRWTLVLDADEEVTADSLPALRALRETPAALTGVYLQIRNAVEDESGAGATMTHQLPRIFPTSPRLRFRNVIHESIALDGTEEFPAVVSPIVILHKGYTREMLDGRNKEVRNKALLERAIAEEGDSAFSWFNFGTSAIAAGDIDAGIDALEKMFSFPGPSRAFHGVAFTQLAIAYAESKHDYERALEVLERGLAAFPDYPSLLFTRGFVLSLQEKYDEARDWYVRSINAAPDARRYFMIDEEIRIWKAPVNIASTFIKEDRHE